jgi:two-component system sensor histidine kinase UhpB
MPGGRRALGLSARVLLAALIALAFSAALGAGFTLLQYRRMAAIELQTNLAGTARVVGFEVGKGGVVDDARFTALFDGSRHVRVSVVGADGQVRAVSRLFTQDSRPPAWFEALIDPHVPGLTVALPNGGRVALTPDPANEIGEDWSGLLDALLIGAVFIATAALIIHLAVARALSPLRAVSAAFKRVEAGHFGAQVTPSGPPEVAALASGFNAMADRLAAADEDNSRLQAEMVRLQDEERADFARDLHDEIGPYLFAVGIDAAAVGQAAHARGLADMTERAGLISGAVAHMQGRVREMLARLRPLRAVELGLAPALTDLAAFWRARRGDLAFTLNLQPGDDIDIGAGPREALYRIAQEAITNAVRHGAPSRIEIALAREPGAVTLKVADDGRGARDVGGRMGFGLLGMRERVDALAGQLHIDKGPTGRGWSVTVRLPLSTETPGPIGALGEAV